MARKQLVEQLLELGFIVEPGKQLGALLGPDGLSVRALRLDRELVESQSPMSPFPHHPLVLRMCSRRTVVSWALLAKKDR